MYIYLILHQYSLYMSCFLFLLSLSLSPPNFVDYFLNHDPPALHPMFGLLHDDANLATLSITAGDAFNP